jgi:hypothetical protein
LIEPDVLVHIAYNPRTPIEQFPYFMEGVKEMRQLGDKRMLLRAEIGGKENKWEVEGELSAA